MPTPAFTYTALPAKVIFGHGTSLKVADQVRALGCVSRPC